MFSIEAKTHPINSHPQHEVKAATFSGARAAAKQLGNRDHIQETVIRSEKTGRIWVQRWAMYAGS